RVGLGTQVPPVQLPRVPGAGRLRHARRRRGARVLPARLLERGLGELERYLEGHGLARAELRRRAADARVLDALEPARERHGGARMSTAVTRGEAEDLLYEEAALLDRWQLEQWLALFTDDAAYLVPSTDLAPGTSPDNALFYIADDHTRLKERVVRL